MKRHLPLLITSFAALTCLFACNSQPQSGNGVDETVVLPDAFKNTNFCIVAGNWNECGAALLFDARLNPEIQTVSSHNDFYDIGFEADPLTKKTEANKTTYFLSFNVTDQVIDDGYFKKDVAYKFWLSYESETYYCGLSKADSQTVELELTEGLM